jgi:hypothetical protein
VLRRILAILLTVIGATTIGLAVASGTVWRPSDTVTVSTTSNPSGTNVVMTLPGVLEVVASQVDIVVSGDSSDEIAAIVAPTEDVLAYLGADPFDLVIGMASWESLETVSATVPDVEAAMEAPPSETPSATALPESSQDSDDATAEPAAEAELEAEPEPDAEPDPGAEVDPAEGSDVAEEPDSEADTASEPVHLDPRNLDLWADLQTGVGEIHLDWTRSFGRWSLFAANLNEGAPAPTITLTWLRAVETPYFIPGIGLGTALFLIGLAWAGYEVSLARRMRVRPVRGRRAAPVQPLIEVPELTAESGKESGSDEPGDGDDAAPDEVSDQLADEENLGEEKP